MNESEAGGKQGSAESGQVRRSEVDQAREARPPAGLSAVRVLPWWAYALGAAVVAGLTGLAIWWLLEEAGGDAKLRIEAFRTGLTVGLGAGGGFALVIKDRKSVV